MASKRNLNLFTTIPIIGWNGRGPDVEMTLYQNSATVDSSLNLTRGMGFDLGPGWTCSYSSHLIIGSQTVTVIADDGTQDEFYRDGPNWVAPPGIFDKLTEEGNEWKLLHKDQSYHVYDDDGLLDRIVDATGHVLTINRESPNNRIANITDAADRVLDFQYNAGDQLQFIESTIETATESHTRSWEVTYDASDRIDQIKDPLSVGGFIEIIHGSTNGLIAQIFDRRFDEKDPGNFYAYVYNADNGIDIANGPKQTTQEFEVSCLPLQPIMQTVYTDIYGEDWTYQYEYPTNVPLTVTNPLGKTWEFDTDFDKNITLYRDPLGNEWTYTHDGSGNVLTSTDPLSNMQSWAYNSANNVTSYTDALEHVTTFRYQDTNWPDVLLTHVDEPPLQQGGPVATTTLTYHAAGDGAGQLETVTDPNGVVTRFDYDEWGQLDEYSEGEIQGQAVASWFHTNDSASRTISSSWPSGSTVAAQQGGGSCIYDATNCLKLCVCVAIGSLSEPAAQSPPTGFPAKPCFNSPFIQVPSGNIDNITYNGLRQAVETELSVYYPSNGTQQRTLTNGYDELGLIESREVDTTEHSAPTRSFTYLRDFANNTFTRTGPDGVETFVHYDAAGRVDFFRRGPGVDPIMTADYEYYDDNLVEEITFGNGVTVDYTYDDARRVTQIKYRNAAQSTLLQLSYFYNDRNEITSIGEINGIEVKNVTFTYDTRGRLKHESRGPVFGANDYHLTYTYDDGGNRLTKVDAVNDTRVDYHYDYVDPQGYGSNNNRLMFSELWDTSDPVTDVLVSETFYYYTAGGNVEFVGTRLDGEAELSGTRFVYAANQRAVAYAIGMVWDGEAPVCDGGPTLTWGREFRYDTGRQRYYSAELNPIALTSGNFVVDSHAWTDYDGDEPYGDFTVTGSTAAMLRSWEPGMASVDTHATAGDVNTKYFGMDHLGTTRMLTNSSGAADDRAVYSAFGERVSGPNHRYGYAGAWGYQAPASEAGTDPYTTDFPYLHVGARYYDPSSGRFLQRDPIGRFGGRNVYVYTHNAPGNGVDPTGLRVWTEVVGERTLATPDGWQDQQQQKTYDDRGEGDAALGEGLASIALSVVCIVTPEPVSTVAGIGGIAFGIGSAALGISAQYPTVVADEWVDVGPPTPYTPDNPPPFICN